MGIYDFLNAGLSATTSLAKNVVGVTSPAFPAISQLAQKAQSINTPQSTSKSTYTPVYPKNTYTTIPVNQNTGSKSTQSTNQFTPKAPTNPNYTGSMYGGYQGPATTTPTSTTGGGGGAITPSLFGNLNLTDDQKKGLADAFNDYGYKVGTGGSIIPTTTTGNQDILFPQRQLNQMPPARTFNFNEGIARGRAAVQASIDAIDANYTQILREQEEEQQRQEGMARAMAARGGELQSSTYGARESELKEQGIQNKEALAGRKAQEIAKLNIQAEQIAQNWANIEIAKQQGEFEMENTIFKQNQSIALSMIQTMGAAGTSFETLDQATLQMLMQNTGMSATAIKDYMTLNYAASLKELATPHVGADGSLQYSIFDGETGKVKTLSTDIVIPQDATNLNFIPGIGIIYQQGGQVKVYDENNIVGKYTAYEMATQSTKQSDTQIQREGKTYINSLLDFMSGSKNINSVSGAEKEFYEAVLGADIRDINFNNGEITGIETDYKRYLNLLNDIGSGFIQLSNGVTIELDDSEIKRFKEKASKTKGKAKEAYENSLLS